MNSNEQHTPSSQTELRADDAIYPCWVNGSTCLVAERFEEEVPIGIFNGVKHLLPCTSCPSKLSTARQLLFNTRLGKRERDVLLQLRRYDANVEGENAWFVGWEKSKRSDREVYLRAIRKLCDMGFSSMSRRSIKKGRWDDRRVTVAWLTPLGDHMVKLYRSELESGARIRWDNRLDTIVRECSRETAQLVEEFAETLTRESARASLFLQQLGAYAVTCQQVLRALGRG